MTTDAEPLLMIPGLMADARGFWHQIVALSKERSVQVFLPVAGGTVEEMARAALAGAPARFALAGHGLGGSVALEMLHHAPDRISRIALLGVNAQAEMPQVAAAREVQIVRARTGRLAEVVAEDTRAAGLAPGQARARVITLAGEMAAGLGADVYVAQCRALQRRPDMQKVLRRALLPALVLCGEDDQVNPPRRHEFIAGLMPFATLQCLPDAGHLVQLEQPAAVTEALRAWLTAPLQLRPA